MLVLEFANREMADLDTLPALAERYRIAAGVIDVKSFHIETPGEVAARLERVLEVVPRERLWVTADCGFSALPRWLAREKLRAMVAGTRLVRGDVRGSGPAGEIDDLECRRLPAGVLRGEFGEQRAPREMARPGGQRIGLAHGAQVGHQFEGRVVSDPNRVQVGDRHVESGALQQPCGVAQVREGGNPGRRAAGRGRIGGQQALAQFGQRFAAEQACEEKAAGLEGALYLGKRARKVLRPVQGEIACDQVEALRPRRAGCPPRRPRLCRRLRGKAPPTPPGG